MFFRVKEGCDCESQPSLRNVFPKHCPYTDPSETHDAPPHRRRKPPVCSRRNGNRIVGIPPTSPKTTLNRDHTQNHPHPPPDPSARPSRNFFVPLFPDTHRHSRIKNEGLPRQRGRPRFLSVGFSYKARNSVVPNSFENLDVLGSWAFIAGSLAIALFRLATAEEELPSRIAITAFSGSRLQPIFSFDSSDFAFDRLPLRTSATARL